jgi:hypothetical protein
MHGSRFVILLLMSIASLLNFGCAAKLPITGKLPEGITVTPLAQIQPGSPIAVSSDGSKIAFYHGGLQILTTANGSIKTVQGEAPSAADWSPDGTKVAIAVKSPSGTALCIYSAQGELLATTEVKAPITSISWLNGSEVAAIGILNTTYKFGSNVSTIFYRWDGKGTPAQLTLKESTLRPGTAKGIAGELLDGNKVTFSSMRDELVFLHPQDPPLITPYYKVFIRNLTSGSSREVCAARFGASAPLFADDEESIILHDSLTLRYSVWEDSTPKTINLSGRIIGISPGGSYWLTNEALYKDDAILLSMNGDVYGTFSSKGDALFVASKGALYRIDGLKDRPVRQLSAEQQEKLIQLRAWRGEGLVSTDEYRTAKERIFGK